MTADEVTRGALQLKAAADTILRSYPKDTYARVFFEAGELLAGNPDPKSPESRWLRSAIGVWVVKDMEDSNLPSMYDALMTLASRLAAPD